MADAAGGEYALPEPSGDWLAGLVAVGEQSRAMGRATLLSGQVSAALLEVAWGNGDA